MPEQSRVDAPPRSTADGDTFTKGLSGDEVAARRKRDGPNRLPPPYRPSGLRRFVDQLVHFFALMLWVAGGLAIVAGMPALGIAIFIVIALNAAFAFVQESRADQAAERLRALLPLRVTVRRDDQWVEISADEVVADDVLRLGSGDRVPADANVIEAHALLVDTSLLTGESEASSIAENAALFAGTFVVEGEALAVVTATGPRTRLANIAKLTTGSPPPESPLARELRHVVRAIAVIALTVGGFFFLLALLLGTPAADGFVFAIGVTVALVPEGLLPTVTLSLAWGAERMAKRQVLVRRLDAVQTLGSTTFICTDKTGTLTRNEMAVVEIWTPEGGVVRVSGTGYEPSGTLAPDTPSNRAAIQRAAVAGVRCSNGYAVIRDGVWRAQGDPMEAAIDVLARRLGVDTDSDRRTTVIEQRFPFDPRRRRMSVVIGDKVIVKGAPDAVLPRCGGVDSSAMDRVLDGFTTRGLRVLALAGRPMGESFAGESRTADELESDLCLYALLALEDPPRADVADAISACRRAGIKIAMITGDHPATAGAIATEVGLRKGDDPVFSGDELPDDEQVLGAMLDRDGVVVARVSPENKLRIARALRARGHVVAMTGDGVNDGPALHEADIGIAMGASGTDVAREAADLVLLDDHFASILAGIEQGRATFVNIRRFLTYHLTDNVAELTPFVAWALSGGRFPLALGVLQILALDIGTDTLSAVALGAEPAAPHILEGPPVSGRLLNHTVARRAFFVLGPTEAVMSMAAFVLTYLLAGWRPGDSFPKGHVAVTASGAAFMAVVLAQGANAFACRSSSRWPGALGWTSNRVLLPAVAGGLSFSLIMLLVGPLARRLGQGVPTATAWIAVVVSPAVLLGVDAIDKHRKASKSRTGARAGQPLWP